PLDEEALRNLVNVDVHAIYPLYVDNLKAFYENARKKTQEREDVLAGIDLFVPPGENAKKYSEALPEGAGWVVEVRGYTYQHKAREFLLDTVVFNTNHHGFGKALVPFGAAPTGGAAAGAAASGNFPDPIEGRVSHAFLYMWRPVENPQPGTFE